MQKMDKCKKILICTLLISVIFISGCALSQDEQVAVCYKNYSEDNCEAQKCAYERTVGYTGYDKYRAQYYECMYNHCKVQ